MGDRNGTEMRHCRSFYIFKDLGQATVLPVHDSFLPFNVKGFSKCLGGGGFSLVGNF